MGSQYAPKSLPIVDPGNVPFHWIDGFESYKLHEGRIFARCFTVKPILQRSFDASIWRPDAAVVCCELGFSLEARMQMLRQSEQAIAQARTLQRKGAPLHV